MAGSGQIDVAVEHCRNLGTGSAGLGIKLVDAASRHDTCLLHSRDRCFIDAADAGGVRKGGCFTDHW